MADVPGLVARLAHAFDAKWTKGQIVRAVLAALAYDAGLREVMAHAIAALRYSLPGDQVRVQDVERGQAKAVLAVLRDAAKEGTPT